MAPRHRGSADLHDRRRSGAGARILLLGQLFEAEGVRVHPLECASPRIPELPFQRSRIPDYDDVAQTLPGFLTARVPAGRDVAIVTHSQGGLIGFPAWMAAEGRAAELARIVRAGAASAHECPIPFEADTGSEDNVVRRASAQSVFPQTGALPSPS